MVARAYFRSLDGRLNVCHRKALRYSDWSKAGGGERRAGAGEGAGLNAMIFGPPCSPFRRRGFAP